MKNILTVLFLLLSTLSLFGQNPIIREELFEGYNDEWNKVSIIDRAYDNQGNLTYEANLYYQNAVRKWIPYEENRYDASGNNIQTTQSYFQSLELGFYVTNIYRQFNEFGELMLEESFVKEHKTSETLPGRRMVRENLEDCSYLLRFYEPNPEGNLVGSATQLFIYDKNCAYADDIYTNEEVTDISNLKNQVRISFAPTRSGGQSRIVEKLACPDMDGCTDWVIRNKKVYDAAGRLIIEERGAINDFFRTVTTTTYEPTQTVVTTDSYGKPNALTTQLLTRRQIITYDLEENIISWIFIDPFSTRLAVSEYNDKGLIHRNLIENSVKDSTGIQVFRDTTNFLYQSYCDDLTAEQITNYGNGYKLKMTYSYLYPADCGQANYITDFVLFPNPVNALLNVKNEAFVNGSYTLDIFDMMGRHIRSVSNYRSNTLAINVDDLPNGLYQLSIQNEEGRITQPFTVQR